jgi:hypothetical protein
MRPATVCLADFDLPTRSASGFLLRYIVPRTGPAQLYAVLARKLPFELATLNSDLIIGMGHGDPDTFTGQNESPILDVGNYNPREVKGKVVKLLSCQAGKILGPDLVQNGALAFMGYKDDYAWVADADLSATPWSDPLAAPCLMSVVASLNVLLDGKTVEEAFQTELDQYSAYAEVEDDELVKSCIEFNMENAVLLGNKDAKIEQRPKIILPIPPPPIVIPLLND